MDRRRIQSWLGFGSCDKDMSKTQTHGCRNVSNMYSTKLIFIIHHWHYIEKDYRITWLRIHSRYQRWREEEQLVIRDMTCTINWFTHARKEWAGHAADAEDNQTPGHAAYAYEQMDKWEQFRKQSYQAFKAYIEVRLSK